MALQIKRVGHGGDSSSPSLWTVLTSGLLRKTWIGRLAPHLAQLPRELGENTLLYFRTRGCTICGLIDMSVAATCHQNGVKLFIIDRYSKSDMPEDMDIYNHPSNILDFGGAINTVFQIGVYPSLVLINSSGKIVLKDVGGGKVPPERFAEYLRGRFQALL